MYLTLIKIQVIIKVNLMKLIQNKQNMKNILRKIKNIFIPNIDLLILESYRHRLLIRKLIIIVVSQIVLIRLMIIVRMYKKERHKKSKLSRKNQGKII